MQISTLKWTEVVLIALQKAQATSLIVTKGQSTVRTTTAIHTLACMHTLKAEVSPELLNLPLNTNSGPLAGRDCSANPPIHNNAALPIGATAHASQPNISFSYIFSMQYSSHKTVAK